MWEVAGVPVTIKRSARRRTVALQVAPGTVTLYAPVRVPVAQLEAILDTRRDWVARHLAAYAARPPAQGALQDGQPLPFLGQFLTVRLEGAGPARRVGETLFLPLDQPKVALERWTRAACAGPYRALVEAYAGQLDAQGRLGRVTVSAARSRWGSCTARGDIRLHWKLSRAPLEVFHYVALHEAAHLLELNHSARYWAHVARIMPDWSRQRAWLREQGHTL
ncbi:M48 family metallopeptidase [Deinococcus sp. HMF7604]|uniref:M48 family metallopeptidase n=1 Tax=Deinococcus betulae TaxID=2873312 RepID=UPI001CCC60D1|nr:SprT family zinc-dependent metalloprotease [Deinococcus betulae]MBZ9752457.1 M48 family metallopeptidase [Deinococcus betulae]